jgi:hypothetical protein
VDFSDGRRRVAAAAVILAVAFGLGGCSASAPRLTAPSPTASSAGTPTIPAGAVTLNSLGLTYAPAGFAIPSGITPLMTANQDNVVTLEFSVPDGDTVHGFLMVHLPGMGWQITASSSDSIIFDTADWQGAFSMSTENAMLTLRRQT